jgi:hypothetical protein
MLKKSDYNWCEHYGGPKDGYWCSTGDLNNGRGGMLSYRDPDNVEHFYVLLTHYTAAKGDLVPVMQFYAYAGTVREALWRNVIVGYPGSNKNNYDPDLEPDWYNRDKD